MGGMPVGLPRSLAREPDERTRGDADNRHVPFGALVRRYRRSAGWTQQELAERARIGLRTISEIERGTGIRPQRETVRLLIDAFGLGEEERAAFERAARHQGQSTLAPVALPPTNLPAPVTPLIGRDDALSAVALLVRDDDVRLVTVTGLGGVGKTRFALAVASALRPQFPDGVWVVHLAAVRDVGLVLAAVARTLETPDNPGQPVRERVVTQIGARRLLLVLDNFEQIIPAAVVVATLLARCPGLKILVTSRERLQIRGEHVYRLDPLPLPGPHDRADLAALARSPAVALFVQRARAADHTFALTAENGAAVAALCHRLDGLPLAIELAAARVAFLPPPALLARMERRLPLLTGGAHDLPERHQTLRDTISWSHDLLTDDERAVFRWLSVFVGGWTLEAAEAVCAGAHLSPEAVFGALESLAVKSLIRLDMPDAMPRYTMLETIREYAEEQLAASGEEEVARCAHAAYYLTVVEGAEDSVFGPEHETVLRRLDRERENLRAALDGAIAGGEAEYALRFGRELWRYWRDRSAHAEGRDRLRAILALDGVAGHVFEEELHFGAGILATDQRDFVAARASFEAALAISTATGQAVWTSDILAQLGRLAHIRGDFEAARAQLEQSLAIRRRHELRWHTAVSLCLLGDLLLDQGEIANARAVLEESLATAQDLGSIYVIDQSLRNLGKLAIAEGDYPAARAHFTTCLSEYRTGVAPYAVAAGVEYLACVAIAEGEPERAARLLGATVALRELTGLPHTARESAAVHAWSDWARDALGVDAFTAAWRAGGGLTEDEAIMLAISPTPARMPIVGR
jgi:predicted ATPase/transcriptional regulator with XRE-family HTH domain